MEHTIFYYLVKPGGLNQTLSNAGRTFRSTILNPFCDYIGPRHVIFCSANIISVSFNHF
jgi:hypothetical protein